jgi:hypothetical protein
MKKDTPVQVLTTLTFLTFFLVLLKASFDSF